MTQDARTGDAVLVERFRRVLTGLAAATGVGTLVELAMLRHWDDAVQLVPWAVTGVVLLATAALAARRTPATVLAARAVGVISALGAAFGVWEHVASNVKTGALDMEYAATWSTMSDLEHLWLGATGGVGPSPPLAPGFLALSGLCLALATLWLRQSPRSS